MNLEPSSEDQLVERITDEIVTLLRTVENASISAQGIEGIGICLDCPDKVRELADVIASRVSATLGVRHVAKGLAGMIDHTLLKPDADSRAIAGICDEARRYGFATVCVNPTNVAQAAQLLRGSRVKVCSVVGFPLGATLPEVKAFEAQRAIRDGASEIDMVINIGALKGKAHDLVSQDIEAVVRECHRAGARCKVIIETALLTEEEKVTACTLAKQAGADFVKTSTGFSSGGATLADVALMRRVVGRKMGVKAAGGIRTFRDAIAMIAVGATRIGASAGVRIMQEAQRLYAVR